MEEADINLTPLDDVERVRPVQTGMGLTEGTLVRLDRLRACIGLSRSRVTEEVVLSGGVNALEKVYAARVRRFNELAARAGMHWERYAQHYAYTYSSRTYPPTVDQLEEMEERAARQEFTEFLAEK